MSLSSLQATLKRAPSHSQAFSVQDLGDRDYARFSQLLLERCGLHFSERRRAELERGICQAFAASMCASLDEYYALLQDAQAGAVEMDRLVNAVTISETHFFRNAAQFDALYTRVLPEIIERRRAVRTLRIWSAGCASGEEPYSVAILLRELLPDVDEWSVTILATDINTASLERARRAIYGEWAFREARAKQCRPRYFRALGNRYELNPEARRMVTFAQLNLAQPCYPSYQTNTTLIDLILCRNVTIYFDQHVTQQVVGHFYNALVDGGWLVVGHAEPSTEIYQQFQTRNYPDTILYQRQGMPGLGWPAAAFPPAISRPQPPILDFKFEISNLKLATGPLIPPKPATPGETDSLEHARELIEFGRSEEARQVLLELLRTKPDHAQACAVLGQACANVGHWEEAEMWCRKAVSLDRLAMDAYYTLSLVLQHQGALDQAVDAMKKVVYIDRNYVLGHFSLANLYRENKQMPQAFKSLDNARRLLNGCRAEESVPGSGGITAGRLREAIIRQQQAWGVGA